MLGIVRTPLVEVAERVYAKMEACQLGGSHKTRAALAILQAADQKGSLDAETTVVEKTGGNFGVGLAIGCAVKRCKLELVVGPSFSRRRRAVLKRLGARLIGSTKMKGGMKAREVLEERIEDLAMRGKRVYWPDQFTNPIAVQGYLPLGWEIAEQLSARVGGAIRRVLLVAGVGTGASATGIARGMREAGVDTRVIVAEPEGCDCRRGHAVDHPFEGISVGVVPPLLDWSLVEERVEVPWERAYAFAKEMWRMGIFIGKSTAVCGAAVEMLKCRSRGESGIVFVCYDNGLWYDDLIRSFGL